MSFLKILVRKNTPLFKARYINNFHNVYDVFFLGPYKNLYDLYFFRKGSYFSHIIAINRVGKIFIANYKLTSLRYRFLVEGTKRVISRKLLSGDELCFKYCSKDVSFKEVIEIANEKERKLYGINTN